ncbi:MAG: ABC transporter substrate-binding protein, partial [Stackebrandtia sp.]
MRGSTGKAAYRHISVLVAVSLAVSMVAACTDEPADSGGVADEPSDGGTVRILTAQPAFSSLDPQRIYITDEAAAAKLMTRTLTTFKAAPGAEGGELVGDLATDTGRPNEDNTAWDFTLRDGIKWDTGKPVTCEDVRYGVLRNFDINNDDDAVITGGPPYPTQWLDVAEDYRGPRQDGTGDVGGVTCTDDKTIHFDLKTSVGDFPFAAAMTAFSPVPEDLDTWEDYGRAPASTGPYLLAKFTESEADG